MTSNDFNAFTFCDCLAELRSAIRSYPEDCVAYSQSNVPWHLCSVGMRQTEVRPYPTIGTLGTAKHAHYAVKRGDGYSAAIAK